MTFQTNIYGALLGWVPVWVWVSLGLLLAVYVGWMWLRVRSHAGRGTVQQQGDRSSQCGSAPRPGRRCHRPARLASAAVGHLGGRGSRSPQLACPVGGSKMVVAPAGAGKTARVIVPDLLQHRGPAVVTSVKTDVLWLTLQRRAAQGPVFVLNPSESAGLGTCRFSPLMSVRSFDDALRAGQWLSDAGHTDDGGIKGQDFWDSLARRMLAPALFLAARRQFTLDDVFGWVQQGSEEFITQSLQQLGDQRAIRAWTSHRSTHDKTKSSIVATAYNLLEGWSSDIMANVSNTHDGTGQLLDIDTLLDHKVTLYLIAANSDQQIYRAVFESVINAVVRRVPEREAATGRPLRPSLLLSLDEAANIAPLRDLGHIVFQRPRPRHPGQLGVAGPVPSAESTATPPRRSKPTTSPRCTWPASATSANLNELSTLLGKTIRTQGQPQPRPGRPPPLGQHDRRRDRPSHPRRAPPATP